MVFALFAAVNGDITGTISFVGSSTVLEAGVTYKFQIQGNNPFQQQGKVLIVFPAAEFTFTPGTILTCLNLDDQSKVLDCQLNALGGILVVKINSTTF